MSARRSNPEGHPFTAPAKPDRYGDLQVTYRPRQGNKRERIKLDPEDADRLAAEAQAQIDQRRREAGARMERARELAAAKRARDKEARKRKRASSASPSTKAKAKADAGSKPAKQRGTSRKSKPKASETPKAEATKSPETTPTRTKKRQSGESTPKPSTGRVPHPGRKLSPSDAALWPTAYQRVKDANPQAHEYNLIKWAKVELQKMKEAKQQQRLDAREAKWAKANLLGYRESERHPLSKHALSMLTPYQRKIVDENADRIALFAPEDYIPMIRNDLGLPSLRYDPNGKRDMQHRPAGAYPSAPKGPKEMQEMLRAIALDLMFAAFQSEKMKDTQRRWYANGGERLIELANASGYAPLKVWSAGDPNLIVNRMYHVRGAWGVNARPNGTFNVTHIPTGLNLQSGLNRVTAIRLANSAAEVVNPTNADDATMWRGVTDKQKDQLVQLAKSAPDEQTNKPRKNPSGETRTKRAPVWAELGRAIEITIAPSEKIKLGAAHKLAYATHERTLYVFPAKPGRFPETASERELYQANVLREQWQGRQPLEVHAWRLEVPGDGERWQSLGPAKAIVYRSDKRSRTGAHTYVHEFSAGVKVEKYRQTLRIRGGRLTVNDRGIVY